MYKLPTDYTKLRPNQRREVRMQYVEEQKGMCYYCGCSLNEHAPQQVRDIKITWKLFPKNFLQHPIHLQHNHDTGMTEGAVHNYCNAVMWEYEGR